LLSREDLSYLFPETSREPDFAGRSYTRENIVLNHRSYGKLADLTRMGLFDRRNYWCGHRDPRKNVFVENYEFLTSEEDLKLEVPMTMARRGV
jgi:hypothetical protein